MLRALFWVSARRAYAQFYLGRYNYEKESNMKV
ncbi:unnamed protein product, partial [marine sediment metagenome]